MKRQIRLVSVKPYEISGKASKLRKNGFQVVTTWKRKGDGLFDATIEYSIQKNGN